jgi:hypothetical protein
MGNITYQIAPRVATHATWVSENPTLGATVDGKTYGGIVFSTDSDYGNIMVYGKAESYNTAYAALQLTPIDSGSADIEEFYQDRKEVGELFYLDTVKTPTEYTYATRRSFFPALCLDTIDDNTDISSTNWPDMGSKDGLVTHLRAKKFTYLDGISGSEEDDFDVTDWAISSNVATLTFGDTDPENAILGALYDDALVHGGGAETASYTDWRSITLPSAIGDITAGEYAITEVDATSRTISFSFTASDNSGSGTYTVNFYQHRIPGSTTTARLFENKGRSLVSANDADGECIAGLRRRDRFQGHTLSSINDSSTAGQTPWRLGGASSRGQASAASAAAGRQRADFHDQSDSNVIDAVLGDDGTNGDPRTGKTSDPRSLIGHVYIWGGKYVA